MNIKSLIDNSRKLIFIDACGALLSAFLLFLLSINYSNQIGIPKVVLNALAYIAILIFIYSFLCGVNNNVKSHRILLSLASINVLYCIVTLGTLIHFEESIKLFGIVYFGIEIMIIIFLLSIEIKVALLHLKNIRK